MENCQFYKYAWLMCNLSVKTTKGVKAPHKAVMLISIMDLIKDGTITSNKIPIENVVADTFRRNWETFISGKEKFSTFVCSPWTPFWHLKQEGYWHFSSKDNQVSINNLVPSGQTASVGKMRSAINYAYLDNELYELLQDSVYRSKLMEILFSTYIN